MYPNVLVYNGSGSTDDEANFHCATRNKDDLIDTLTIGKPYETSTKADTDIHHRIDFESLTARLDGRAALSSRRLRQVPQRLPVDLAGACLRQHVQVNHAARILVGH
jgi:hypothetical protein